MKKIIAFGASTSSSSINHQLATFATTFLENTEIQLLDLNDFYNMPIYDADEHKTNGIPELAHSFLDILHAADGFIVSFAEHNGSYTAAFKNIYDWASVINQKVWNDKPLLILGAAPGARGAITVINAAAERFPWMGAKVSGTFSFPKFHENFNGEKGIVNDDLLSQLKQEVRQFEELVHATEVVVAE